MSDEQWNTKYVTRWVNKCDSFNIIFHVNACETSFDKIKSATLQTTLPTTSSLHYSTLDSLHSSLQSSTSLVLV